MFWRYIVMMNETPPTVDVRTSARVFALSTDLRLRNSIGIKGDLDRDSMTRNDRGVSADRPSGTIVSSPSKPRVEDLGNPKNRRIIARGTIQEPLMPIG